jgi:tetratricopeptide (TPR) repeat protein
MPTLREIGLAHATHYESVLRSANELYKQGGKSLDESLKIFDWEWNHIKFGLVWAASYSSKDELAARLCNEYLNFPYLFDLRLHALDRIPLLETALSAARQLGQREAESTHLGNLGLAYLDLGEPHKAIELFKQQFLIASEIDDWQGQMATAGNLGNACSLLGKKELAITFFRSQKRIARLIGDQQGESNALNNIGKTYSELGEAKKALRYIRQSLSIKRKIGDRRGEGIAMVNIGVAFHGLGNIRKTLEYYEKGAIIAGEIGDKIIEGTVLWNMSLILAGVNMSTQAISYAESALKLYEQVLEPRTEEIRRQLDEWKSIA